MGITAGEQTHRETAGQWNLGLPASERKRRVRVVTLKRKENQGDAFKYLSRLGPWHTEVSPNLHYFPFSGNVHAEVQLHKMLGLSG